MSQRLLRLSTALFVPLFVLAAAAQVRASDDVESAGNVLVATLPIAAAGLSLYFKDGQGTLEFGESAALAMGVMYVLKVSVDETRPNGRRQSFPSGHATLSFTSAEFLRKRYGWRYGLPAYTLATFVAYSRVEAGQHYTVDVLVGAAIGVASSYLMTRPYKGWKIRPEAGRSYLGVSLAHGW